MDIDLIVSTVIWIIAIVGVLILVAVITGCFGIIRCLTVEEATAVAFKYRGKYVYCQMSFEGHYFNEYGFIQKADKSHDGPNYIGGCRYIWRAGGWIFYIWPLVEPARYADYSEADGFGEGFLVRLGDVTSDPGLAMAQTAEPEKVQLRAKFKSVKRIVNPVAYLFVAPRDVAKQVTARENAALRSWIKSGTSEDAQEAQGNGKLLWKKLVQLNWLPVFDDMEEQWGVQIQHHSIMVEEISYTPEYTAALEAQGKAKLDVAASIEETAGRILRSVAMESGVDVDNPDEFNAFTKKLKDDPTLRGKPASAGGYMEAFDYAKDQTKRDRAGVGLFDTRIGSSAGGPLPSSLQYLSVGGGGGAGVLLGGKRAKGNKKKSGRFDDDEDEMSDEEVRAEEDRRIKAENGGE